MDLCDALRAEFLVSVDFDDEEDSEDFLGALDVFGSNRAAAEFFAGSSDRKSPAYRAALRRVQRYRKSASGVGEFRRPLAADRERLLGRAREVLRERRAATEAGGPVTITALVQVSTDKRRRTLHSNLDAECRQHIAELLAAGLCDEAEEAFIDCFTEGAGWVGGADPAFLDVDALGV